MSVNVFSMKILTGDTVVHVYNLRWDCHLTWSSEPCEGQAACSAKGVPNHFSVIFLRPWVMVQLWESNLRPPALLWHTTNSTNTCNTFQSAIILVVSEMQLIFNKILKNSKKPWCTVRYVFLSQNNLEGVFIRWCAAVSNVFTVPPNNPLLEPYAVISHTSSALV